MECGPEGRCLQLEVICSSSLEVQDLQAKVAQDSSLTVETNGSEESSGCGMSFVEVGQVEESDFFRGPSQLR